MIIRRITLAAIPAALALTLGAYAQTGVISPNATRASSPHASGSSLPTADLKFVEKVAADGLAEVEFGKLAQQKAHSDDVKKFAERMVSDHTKANDQLKPIASAKNVVLPSGLSKKDQKELDHLAKLDADKFDREYMKHMVSDHKKDVKAFEKEAKKGKDDDVRNFASSTLPTLEEHLRLAEAANDAVKGKKR